MAEEKTKNIGIIPDFFFDIIAYIIPGYTIIILIIADFHIAEQQLFDEYNNMNLSTISVTLLIAYVLGKLLEQLGYMTIHKYYFPFKYKSGWKHQCFNYKSKQNKPKWDLLFDEKNTNYTPAFKNEIKNKIENWLDNLDSKTLMEECEKEGKDDYFNLIQFYLRERFPSIALYEKKQNATIVLTRSLFIIFNISTILYLSLLFNNDSPIVWLWIIFNVLASFIFYKRYHQDKIYHAMYIFEAFIATKKLLKSTTSEKKKLL